MDECRDEPTSQLISMINDNYHHGHKIMVKETIGPPPQLVENVL